MAVYMRQCKVSSSNFERVVAQLIDAADKILEMESQLGLTGAGFCFYFNQFDGS